MADSEGHRAVSRALHALELAAASKDGITLGELAHQMGAAKSSLHPLLKALVFRGYLTYDGSRYRTGPSIGALAAVDSPSIVPIAQPFMDDLVRQFDETVMLGRVVGETLIYLHNVESNQVVRYSPPRVRPPSDHPSSIEKLYLAQRDDEQIDLYIGEHIHPSKQEACAPKSSKPGPPALPSTTVTPSPTSAPSPQALLLVRVSRHAWPSAGPADASKADWTSWRPPQLTPPTVSPSCYSGEPRTSRVLQHRRLPTSPTAGGVGTGGIRTGDDRNRSPSSPAGCGAPSP